MHCWKCQKLISDLPLQIGFRATCKHCNQDLHVCKNCRYYSPGKPNDCIVPGTEWIQDKERSNLCEEFKPKTILKDISDSKRAQQLFGSDAMIKNKNFNDLFKE